MFTAIEIDRDRWWVVDDERPNQAKCECSNGKDAKEIAEALNEKQKESTQ